MRAPATPESAEEYYARVAAATDGERRLAVAPEEMSGWDIFPFEVLQTNAAVVARHLRAAVGGESPAWSEV